MDTKNADSSGTRHTSNSSPSNNEQFTVEVEKYVAQLEKRLLEQEQLIALLNQKVASFESVAGDVNRSSYADTIKRSNPGTSGGGEGRHFAAKDHGPSFVGSKKTTISSVVTVKYSQFFVTRLDPALSAVDLSKDLLKDVESLSSVKCSKLKTRHSSYASFHVVVSDEEKQLVSCAEVWPEGAFVKTFSGKLLQSYILESYDSLTDEFKSFTPPAVDLPKEDKQPHTAKKTTAAYSKATPKGHAEKTVAPGKKTSTKNNRVAAVGDSASVGSSPTSNVSPKNLRHTKTTKKT